MAILKRQTRQQNAYVTVKDLQQFQKVMMDQFRIIDERFSQRLFVALEQHGQDLKRDIRDELDAKFGAMNRKMDTMKQDIISEVTSCIGDQVMPNIDILYDRVEKLEKHVGLA